MCLHVCFLVCVSERGVGGWGVNDASYKFLEQSLPGPSFFVDCICPD